jgi:hypothetical protein
MQTCRNVKSKEVKRSNLNLQETAQEAFGKYKKTIALCVIKSVCFVHLIEVSVVHLIEFSVENFECSPYRGVHLIGCSPYRDSTVF